MDFSRPLDAALAGALGLARRLPVFDPVAAGLSHHRRRVAEEVVTTYAPRLQPLHAGVLAQEPAAIRRYDALAGEAVAALRAAPIYGGLAPLGWLERRLYHDGAEFLDDPAYPRDKRLRILDAVDWLNQALGSYALWEDFYGDLLPSGGAVKIHDLCAGHGGLAVALKQRLGDRAEITASDIKEEYLAMGRQRAAALGVDVRFVVQDATDLRGVGEVDLFLCTQSVHHFPPGMVARMLGQAARSARLGACFIDAERGWLPLLVVPPLVTAKGRSYGVLHDTVVSLRRMYYAEELLLLGRLAPGLPPGARVEARRRRPGFCCVRVMKDQAAGPYNEA